MDFDNKGGILVPTILNDTYIDSISGRLLNVLSFITDILSLYNHL